MIERTQRAGAVREIVGPALAQANHHVDARFVRNNNVLGEVEEEGFHKDSSRHAEALGRTLTEAGPTCTFEEVSGALNVPPVFNRYRVQRMAFCPRTGDVRVWRGRGLRGWDPPDNRGTAGPVLAADRGRPPRFGTVFGPADGRGG